MVFFSDFFERFEFEFLELQISGSMEPKLQMSAFCNQTYKLELNWHRNV
jgi:hypothetical protein